MSNDHPPQFSVHSLLHRLGIRHTTHRHAHLPAGYTDDHIVELQLVVAALNRIPPGSQYGDRNLRSLVLFFNRSHNMQRLRHEDNEEKGRAVTHLIRHHINDHIFRQGRRYQQWIEPIRNTWIQLSNELDGFSRFKQELNVILDVDDDDVVYDEDTDDSEYYW